MKPGRWRRIDGAFVWLVAAILGVLVGQFPIQRSGAADREVLAALPTPLPAASSRPSSSNAGTGSDLFVPVILTASGASNAYYTSELTLTNRGSRTATLHYTYTAAAGGGNGAASETLAPGRQKIVPDAIDYLQTLGVPIPPSGNRIGTLRVGVSGSSEVSVTVRTTTQVSDGRAGLAYPAVAAADGFTEAVYLCGLRQNRQDRSNVAFQNMGVSGNITLRATVYSGDPEAPGSHVMPEVTLAAGGFHQYSGLLAKAGFSQGYVKVERVSGTGPFYAYGVINDQANSDGSFVFPVTASSLAGVRGLTLPVVIEHPNFSTELIVTNFSNSIKSFDVHFVSDAIGTPDKTASITGDLIPPGGQAIIPDAVQMLRESGAEGIGPRGRTIAGAAFFTASVGDLSGVVIGARTGSPGGGGQYSVFYNAVPYGAAFEETAWIDALQQNEENRSNLALVNTGEVDGSPSVFQLDIYDGATGLLANTVTGLRVVARGWRQINGILDEYAPGTTQGYVRIQKISGNNPFLAYGVVNDGGAPGQRSDDGAYLPASATRKRIDDPGTSPATDREALVALYEATDGPNWVNKDNWLTDVPLGEWYGVDTYPSGRVVRLDLFSNNLTGSIPPAFGGLSRLTTLELAANQIDDISPLSGLINLVTLSLEQNNLTDISPLARLTNLKSLSVGEGPISDLSALSGLSKLTRLKVFGTATSDLAPLSGLTNLGSLVLSHGKIADISELAQLTGLTRLVLWDNQIEDISPLAGLTNLTFLSLAKNNIEDISQLAELAGLTDLFLNDNDITNVSPLSGLTNLTFLNLSGNSIEDVSPLAGLTNLRDLNLSANNITDISPLAGLTNLRDLDVRGNPYESLPKGDFDVELVLLDDFTESEKNVLQYVARRWMAVVTSDLPDYEFKQGWSGVCGSQSIEISPGDRIDDLRIYVNKERLNVLGFGGPLVVRETTHLPVLGCMGLDLSHANLLTTGLHEVGHVLGVGSLWRELGYFQNPPDGDQHFNGPLAIAAFDAAGGRDYAGAKVPAEEGHWREGVFGNELMTPTGTGAISAITVQSLADLGYVVDVAQADSYTLPAAAQASATHAVVTPALLGDGRASERLPSPTQASPRVWCSLYGEREPIHVVDQQGRFIRTMDN